MTKARKKVVIADRKVKSTASATKRARHKLSQAQMEEQVASLEAQLAAVEEQIALLQEAGGMTIASRRDAEDFREQPISTERGIPSPSSATLAVKCLFLRGGRSKIFTTIG